MIGANLQIFSEIWATYIKITLKEYTFSKKSLHLWTYLQLSN